MSVCDRCDAPAEVKMSLVMFEGDLENDTATVWDLELCGNCARDLPSDLSLILQKEPVK